MGLGDQITECDAAQEFMNARAQVFPQLMGQTCFIAMTVFLAATTRGIDVLVNGNDDFRYRDLRRRHSEVVAPAGSAHAVHQTAATQLGKQLLEIRK